MQTFKTGMVQANGLRFHFLEIGEGPLALCLHGFPDHARSFRHQLPTLAAAGYRAVAPYLRGYAPTDVPANGPYQAAALAQDTVALIDALGSGPAMVFGHDWGAVAAHGAAVIAPEKISKLITAKVWKVTSLRVCTRSSSLALGISCTRKSPTRSTACWWSFSNSRERRTYGRRSRLADRT